MAYNITLPRIRTIIDEMVRECEELTAQGEEVYRDTEINGDFSTLWTKIGGSTDSFKGSVQAEKLRELREVIEIIFG